MTEQPLEKLSLTTRCDPSDSENSPYDAFVGAAAEIARNLARQIGSFESGTYEITVSARHIADHVNPEDESTT